MLNAMQEKTADTIYPPENQT